MIMTTVAKPSVAGESDTLQTCVDRILQSAAFRNSPTSRRLLKYLADHSLAGNAEQLKEYTIGVDAFGKAEGYDPRQDSTVRIQIGRLRQKLSDYYLEEGKDDPQVVELPKGRFGLTLEPRAESTPYIEPVTPARDRWRVTALVFAALFVLAAALALYAFLNPRLATSGWTPELAELWRPFVNTSRPLLIAVGNPLFLQFENKALYRDLSIEDSQGLLKSPALPAISKALGSRESRPIHYYAAVGEVGAAFLLGQRLGTQQPNMSVVRSSQLQWQQLADANVLFLGPPRFFGDKLTSLPVSLEITEATDGFAIVHPQPGQPSLYKFREPQGFLSEDGEACVLITHAPGPVGSTDVMTVAGNSTFGRVGAIDAFTDAAFARTLAARMGRIPQYFQILLRVKYKGGVPTETSYLLHREIRRR
jgi:hypothetical protein